MHIGHLRSQPTNYLKSVLMATAVLFFMYMGMYLFMFASAIKLRRAQPDLERPIKIRGLPAIAGVGMVAAVSAIVLGLTPPWGFSSTSPGVYALIVAAGVIALAVPPQIIYRLRRPSWSNDAGARGALKPVEPDDA